MIKISTWINDDCTIGRLSFGDFRCFTLELPWYNNMIYVSCIPAGMYEGEIYVSPKFGRVILINGVTDRSMIEIHYGNYTRDIKGCILVGSSLTYLDNDTIVDVANSKSTLKKLISSVPPRFNIEIERTPDKSKDTSQ